MRALVAGASGVLGRAFLKQWIARGHEAVGLVRREPAEQELRRMGAEPARASLFDVEDLVPAGAGCDVFVHAATKIPTKLRPRKRDWNENDRIRREGTACLLEAARRCGAKRYLQQSVVWVVYGDAGSYGEEHVDEDSPPRPNGILESAVEAEHQTLAAASEELSTAVLRCGWFYSANAAHTRMLARGLERRGMPIIGTGLNHVAMLHVEDAASAFVAAAEAEAGGRYHVLDDQPVLFADFLRRFAELLDAPAPWRMQPWLARILAGKDIVHFSTIAMNTSNARFRAAFDWAPRYPTVEEGLRQVIAAWRAEAKNGTASSDS